MQESLLNTNAVDMASKLSSDTVKNLMENNKEITDADYEDVTSKTDEEMIDAHNAEIMKNPEYQGLYMYQNYIHEQEANGNYLSGKQKRAVRRDFLRKAKKGKFNHIFDQALIDKKIERSKKSFDELNAPTKQRTVDDLSEDTKAALLDMEKQEVPTTTINSEDNLTGEK